MQTITPTHGKPYALIGASDGLPYGFPADTVALEEWAVSSWSGMGPDGRSHQSMARRIVPGSEKTEPHPDLYGKLFPTSADADRAHYEAGVTAYFMRLDSPEYQKAMDIIGA